MPGISFTCFPLIRGAQHKELPLAQAHSGWWLCLAQQGVRKGPKPQAELGSLPAEVLTEPKHQDFSSALTTAVTPEVDAVLSSLTPMSW